MAFPRIAALLALLLLAAPAAAPPAAAQAAGPYTVADVEVDLTRETSAIARQEALEQAYVEAFERLLQRVAPADQYGRLPKVDYAMAADNAAGLRIDDERTTATRYAAKFTVAFRQDRVRSLLRNYGVSYAETAAAPVVAAPVYAWAGALSLWEQNNPWLRAWMERGPADGLAPVLLPQGDLADSGALSATQAAGHDRARLAAFAARYGAAGVLVAEASYAIDPVSGRPRLEVTAEVVGDGPDIGRFRQTEEGAPGTPPEELGVRAADAIVAALEASWKRRQAGPGTAGLQSLVADLSIGSLRDFAEARRRLDASPGVARHELVALSRDRARLRLYYAGAPDTVRAGVARQSMDLAPAGPGSDVDWVLVAPPTFGGR